MYIVYRLDFPKSLNGDSIVVEHAIFETVEEAIEEKERLDEAGYRGPLSYVEEQAE